MKRMIGKILRAIAGGVNAIYHVINRCIGRRAPAGLPGDVRRMLIAFGVRPGSPVYDSLLKVKKILFGGAVGGLGGADATCLLEGDRGFNILYCHGRYYAWPQSAGGFSEERFAASVATEAVAADSLADLRAALGARLAPNDGADWSAAGKIAVAACNVDSAEKNRRAAAEEVDNFPTVLIVSTAVGCNLRCKMCYLSSDHELSYNAVKPGVQMSDETFRRVREELLPKARDLIITVEGEILLHRNWVDRWLETIREFPNLKLSLQTNGMLLTDELIGKLLAVPTLTQVAFSIDGATPEVNDAIRCNAKLDVVLTAIRRLLAAREAPGVARPNVHTHFVMMRENIHELPAYIERMVELGVDSISARHLIVYHADQIPYSLYFDQDRCDEMILAARAVARRTGAIVDLPKTFAESRHKTLEDRAKCPDPWRHGQILHDGSVFSCCNNAIRMGNINDAGFGGVWNNEKFRRLRRTVNVADPEYTLCKYCNALLPVNLFEAHVYTKLLLDLLKRGELDKYCPGPVQLQICPNEKVVE